MTEVDDKTVATLDFGYGIMVGTATLAEFEGVHTEHKHRRNQFQFNADVDSSLWLEYGYAKPGKHLPVNGLSRKMRGGRVAGLDQVEVVSKG